MNKAADLGRLGAIAYAAGDPAAAGGTPRALLVLAHGAGAGQQHPFMVATARGLATRGLDVVTFDFPYMARGRGAPDRPPVLEQSFRDVVGAARGWSGASRLFIGGKSMGGRMATHLGAQGLPGLNGIVVLGYPLHPPGKPEQLRVAHLPSIDVPVLIVQGERDTFGGPGEFTPHLAAMKAKVTLHEVKGADHSLSVRGAKGKGVHDSILDAVVKWVHGSG
jgi:predicted alpha/beta-hydrolase family hydrolase